MLRRFLLVGLFVRAPYEQGTVMLGHSEDMLAICGSRMYVFFLDAAPTERLVSQEGSLLTYLEEEDDLQVRKAAPRSAVTDGLRGRSA